MAVVATNPESCLGPRLTLNADECTKYITPFGKYQSQYYPVAKTCTVSLSFARHAADAKLDSNKADNQTLKVSCYVYEKIYNDL